MDMDMDMDAPLPEELELLEANDSHLHDYLTDDSYSDLELDTEQQPPKPDPPLTQTQTQPRPKKKLRPESPLSPPDLNNSSAPQKDHNIEDVDDEEDWLRYSPPQRINEKVDDVAEKEEKIVSRYASEIEGDVMAVTGVDGERVYVKMCGVGNEEEVRVKKLDVKHYSNGLMPEPINVLMERVEHDSFTKALQASVEGQSDAILTKTPVVNEQLWVDKYSPNSFLELLSDEQTNREVLLWLKQWDSSVFGYEIKTTTDDVLSALRLHSSVSQHRKFTSSSFSRSREPRLHKESFNGHNNLYQEDGVPKGIQELWNKKQKGSGPTEQKILLLCGPPGLGKTTLAHVAARHCGYRVVEINASDDRSSATIEAKILDVVQMNSVIGDSKPKCLVIDEIDGAQGEGKGAVEVILKMVSTERKSDNGKENATHEEQSGRKSSKKKQKNASLLRPVICICNDLYAPALRQLRQVAKVHIFVQPTVSRVVSRLKYICNKEGLKTSSIALTALAEYTECDIRACLNTLQFLNKKKENLNVLEISSQVVGRKDISKSVFDIWKEIFQKRRAKRERKSLNGSSVSKDFEFLHSLISNRGDYDLILDGIHENILQLHYHDPVMQKTVKCLNNFGVSDMIHQYIMRTQQMSLLVYLPPIAIAVHGLIAQVERPNIEWPKSFQRYRTIKVEKMDIFRSWHHKISPYISRHLSTKSFVEDLISPLLHLLSPPTLRPVALHLLSEKEKNDLAELVNMMVSYAITYKNVKSDPLPGTLRHETDLDASALSFDPPISHFINFKGYRSSHFILALAVKQVLVHEVEKKKILQGSINRSVYPIDVSNKENKAVAGGEIGKALASRSYCATSSAEKMTNVKNPLVPRNCELATSSNSSTLDCNQSTTASVKLRSPEKTKKPNNCSNFFDRFRKASNKGTSNANDAMPRTMTMERDSRPLLFKFNEGFTNAVKRPVRIREFLL